MRIQNGCTVTLNYTVTSEDGTMIDPGTEPMVYQHGDEDGLFPKLQAALAGKAVGETITATLQADDAFGPYDHGLVRIENLARLGEDLEVGMQLEGSDPDGETTLFVVTEIDGDKVTLDANHPLAGLVLVFNCTVAVIEAP